MEKWEIDYWEQRGIQAMEAIDRLIMNAKEPEKGHILTYKDFIDAVGELYRAQIDRPENMMVVLHPLIWNGYWYFGRGKPILRWLGRKLHNKYIYWLGRPIRWITGVKDWPEVSVKCDGGGKA